ncbi:MAG: hypothetical protein KDC35_13800 [Acidobacteria bacterium]|nr:hypothetical protein [Acidobacteriota bacterium]
MQSKAGRILCTCITIFSLASCYRSTNVPTSAVSSYRVTKENASVLPSGVEANGRIGDIVIQTNYLLAVINGDLSSAHRDHFRRYSGGAILDFTTRFVDLFANYQTRDDDGLHMLAQGVNLNPDNPIRYDAIDISNPDFVTSALTLTGRVIDVDGSLQAAGASVDPASRALTNCIVTTRIDAQDTSTTENDVQVPVLSLKLTTIIRNESTSDLPIFTANDHAITPAPGTSIFVPYPRWGFERPDQSSAFKIAYVPFVLFQPFQTNAAHYAAISETDAMVAVASFDDPSKNTQHTLIGKVGRPGQYLPAGGELTFIREYYVLDASQTDETMYETGVSKLIEKSRNDYPYSSFAEIGAFRGTFNYINAPDASLVLEYHSQSVDYYNGSNWVPLPPGETLPWFGTRKNNDPSLSLPCAPGKIQVNATPINAESETITERTQSITNDEGEREEQSLPIEVVAGETFDLRIIPIGQAHFSFRYSAKALGGKRMLLSKIQVEPLNGLEFSAGDFPGLEQGHTLYLSGELNSHRLVRGQYRLYMSRGPLFNVNSLDLNIQDTVSDDAVTTTTVTPSSFDAELGQVIQLPGYLSADFEMYSNYDREGLLDINRSMIVPFAEDLDLVFFMDRDIQPEIVDRFISLALVQGAFDDTDEENNVDSLFDELAPSRCTAVSGPANEAAPHGRGVFGVLNLPDRELVEFIDIPLVANDVAGFYDRVRAISDDVLITVVRPRAPLTTGKGLFSAIAADSGLDQSTPLTADNALLNRESVTGSGTTWLDFDMIQVLSGNRYAEYLLSRADWFNLLNAGVFKPAIGGTGNTQTRDLLGVVRTFVEVANTQLRDNDLNEFWRQAAAGASFITNGPLIEISIGNAGPGERITTNTPNLNVVIQSAPWIPVDEMRIIVDGDTYLAQTLTREGDELTWLNQSFGLALEPGSHWISVEAGASLDVLAGTASTDVGTFGKVYPGHVPVAFTNPIFVEVSGN